jgi:hypothetical protein
MSYSDIATTGYRAMPAELYEFRYGNDSDDIVRFTSADQDLTFGANTYTSITIERDTYDEDGNPDDGKQLSIRIQRDNPFADIYRTSDFDTAVTFKLRAVDLNDPDLQIIGLYSGRLTGVSWEHPHMVVSIERMTTTMKRSALRARYQRQCRHALYHGQCQLDKASWAKPAHPIVVHAPTQLVINEAAAYDDGYFTGGIIEYNNVMRYITGHAGSAVTLNREIIGLADNLSDRGIVNQLLFSEELNNAVWSAAGLSITADAVNAPDGYQTADLLVGDGATASPRVYQSVVITETDNVEFAFSLYVKENDAPYIALQIRNETSGDLYCVKWLWTAGVLAFDSVLDAAGVSDTSNSITDIGDGWYRITITATLVCAVDDVIQSAPFLYYAEAGFGSSYLWGAQLEAAVVSAYQRNYDHLGGLAEVTLYPGCDRLAATCSSKFNNIENYGGFDFAPSKGPFEGNSLV